MCKMIHYKGKYIADIKHKYILNIVKLAELCENINRIMLFGSSLEERFTDESDIDIAVFGKQSKNKYLQSKEFKDFQKQLFLYDLNQDYDILYFAKNAKQNDLIFRTLTMEWRFTGEARHDFDKRNHLQKIAREIFINSKTKSQ